MLPLYVSVASGIVPDSGDRIDRKECFSIAMLCASKERDRSSIVISCLQEMNLIAFYQVDDAMFLRKAARPCSCQEILQMLGLPNPRERIFQDCLYQVQGA